VGNTCFINAALQCLRSTPGLLERMASELLEDPSSIPAEPTDPLMCRHGADVSCSQPRDEGALPACPNSALGGPCACGNDEANTPILKQLSVDSVLLQPNGASHNGAPYTTVGAQAAPSASEMVADDPRVDELHVDGTAEAPPTRAAGALRLGLPSSGGAALGRANGVQRSGSLSSGGLSPFPESPTNLDGAKPAQRLAHALRSSELRGGCGDHPAAAAMCSGPATQLAKGAIPLTAMTIDELTPGDIEGAANASVASQLPLDTDIHAAFRSVLGKDMCVSAQPVRQGPEQLAAQDEDMGRLAQTASWGPDLLAVAEAPGQSEHSQSCGSGGRAQRNDRQFGNSRAEDEGLGVSPQHTKDEDPTTRTHVSLTATDEQVATSILHVMVRLAVQQRPVVVVPRRLMSCLRDHPSVRLHAI
jgi:hypothetical protein